MDEEEIRQLAQLGYELVAVLGKGGMGQVWRARDIKLDRAVAIKFIRTKKTFSNARERFQIEARALARITHPNVVTVYSLGELGEQMFLVYELVEGDSLDTLVGALRWRRALNIAIDLSRGLVAAHAAGVLHRDIKPANAMLTSGGVAKLIDFGLAKLRVDQPRPGPGAASKQAAPATVPERSSDSTMVFSRPQPSTPQTGITLPNTVMGTPRYISPEMWLGARASPATDVYALALLIWELLAGTVVYEGVPGKELVKHILHDSLPPLKSKNPALPDRLAWLIDGAVSKAADARLVTAKELLAGLESIGASLSSGGAYEPPLTPVSAPARSHEHSTRTSVSSSVRGFPRTRWIRAGEVSLAVQSFGAGDIDLVFIPAWVTHCEVAWRLPEYAAFMTALGGLARVSVFDKRGTGMSDRLNEPTPLERRVLDIPAVLDDLGVESAVLFGVQDGGVLASMFAATHPERVRGLIWYGSAERLLLDEAHPHGMPREMFDEILASIEPNWGTPLFAEFTAPSRALDATFLEWWSNYLRNGASPGTARWLLEANATLDSSTLLEAVSVPSLILHREGDLTMPLRGGEQVARSIADARWVVLEGQDHQPWIGDYGPMLDTVEGFLAQLDTLPRGRSKLHTVLVSGGELRSFSGPVAALEHALTSEAVRPALVHVAMSSDELVSSRAQLLAQVATLEADSVVANAAAVALAGGSRLRFEPYPDAPDLQLASRG